MALSLIRKVLVTWLFGLLRVRMARPLRGHAWPGGCASTSKFIITAIQNCLIGSSSQEICEHVSLCQHHLLPPASTHSWPQTWAMCWGSHSWSDAMCWGSHGQMLSPQGRVQWSELEVHPHSPGFLLLFPGTSTHLILCLCVLATPIHGGACVYLPLQCLVKVSPESPMSLLSKVPRRS